MKESDALIEKLTKEYDVPPELLDRLNADTEQDKLKILKFMRDYMFTLKPVKSARKPTKFFFSGIIHPAPPSTRLALSNTKPKVPPQVISGIYDAPDGIFRPKSISKPGYVLIVNGFFPVSDEQAKAFKGG